jgi:DNA-directed RNA polymerase subunit M/transcription elongation factor TFIIS
LKFCEKCGSYMEKVPGGFSCPKCGNQAHDEAPQVVHLDHPEASSVEVVEKAESEYAKVNETCPKCGNPEAYRSLSEVAGEHAGIRQERAVERLRCTKCQYSWSRT